MAAGLAVFVITKADMSGDEMALAFVAALPAMLRMVAKRTAPFCRPGQRRRDRSAPD
jgi:hypothetical protein